MKEKFPTFYKIAKIPRWLFKNWIRTAEIIVVIWAANGMWRVINLDFYFKEYYKKYTSLPLDYHLVSLFFYFLSAVLILYLLRKYERKN